MKQISPAFKLIKRALEIYFKKENLSLLIQIYLPLAVLTAFSGVYSTSEIFSEIPNSFRVWSFNVLYIFITVFVAIAGVNAIIAINKGNTVSVRDLYRISLKKYWIFFLLSLFLFVVNLLGFTLLIAPGILVVTLFAFSKFILLEENLSIKKSLLRSRKMVKGIFWKVFGRLFLFALFTILTEMVLTFLPFGLGTVIVSLGGALFIIPNYLLYKELSAK